MRSPELDPSQRAVLALGDGASAIVLGAAGTGKTTTLIEFVASSVARHASGEGGVAIDDILVIAGSRQAATRLRDRLAARLDSVSLGPLARSMPSFAHAVLTADALATGAARPQLLSGAEQDRVLATLLAGHVEDAAEGLPAPAWPEHLGPEVRAQPGFRAELRILLDAAAERGLEPEALAALGRERGRPEWVAAAAIARELDRVQRLGAPDVEPVSAAALLRRAARTVLETTVVALPRLVVVDDAQELTEGAVVVLEALRKRGAAVVAFGDPDTATGGFRGADPSLLGTLPRRLGFDGRSDDATHGAAGRLELAVDHRHGERLRALHEHTTTRIGTALGGTHRRPEAAGPAGVAERRVVASLDAEARTIARVVHERRRQGVAFDDIAVIARSGAAARDLARRLTALDLPVAVGTAAGIRDVPVVDALITVLGIAAGREPLTAATTERLLRSELLGLDALAVRRLKRALRHARTADGRVVHALGAELLREAVLDPAQLDRLAGAARAPARVARRLATMLERARAVLGDDGSSAADREPVDGVLWAVWDAAGVADEWRETALGRRGTPADHALANRRLDAVVALFDSVKRQIERTPDLDTAAFVDAWHASTVDDDSLAARATDERVRIGTPSAFVGVELDTVVVAGVQEGVWPDLRPRGSLLHALELDAVAPADARTSVLHDELRTFAAATSRARSAVVVTAVASDDEQPSPFLSDLDDGAEFSQQWHSLRSLVAALRRSVVEREDAGAAAALARLAAAGVPGADPAEWAGLAAISTTERLDADGEPVSLSPSSLQSLRTCELAWIVDRLSGSRSSQPAAIGTLVHQAVEHVDAADAAAVTAHLEARLAELPQASSWEAARERAELEPLAAALAEYFLALRGEQWHVDAAAHEARFEIPVLGGVLRGSIDWIEHRKGPDGLEVRIVDLKTGKRKPQEEPEIGNLQLRAYELALERGAIAAMSGLGEPVASSSRLVMPKVAQRTVDSAVPFAEVRERFEQLVREAIETIGGAEFEATPSEHCLDRYAFGSCRIHVIPEVTE